MAPSLPTLIPLLFFLSAQSTNASTGTSVWVSVDASGQPTTVTPVVTTLDGSRTVVNGAPAEAAGEVVTQAFDGTVVTSTRAAPLATASNAAGAGSFTPCENPDGEFAPFCSVGGGGPLLVGNTYYIKWDAAFYASNATVEVTGSYVDDATGEAAMQAFTSGQRESAWGFWAFNVDSAVLKDGADQATVALALAAIEPNSDVPKINNGPRVVIKKSADEPDSGPRTSSNKYALMIGLPIIAACLALVMFGVCMWNRNTRRVGIRNVMGRGAKGYGTSIRTRLHRLSQTLAKKNGAGRPYRRHQDHDDSDGIPLEGHPMGTSILQDDAFLGQSSAGSSSVGGGRTRNRNPAKGGASGKDEQPIQFSLGPGIGKNVFREELDRQRRNKMA